MTKEQAQWLIDADLYPVEIGDALQALADGRTACVSVMSEEECRAEFYKWFDSIPPNDDRVDCWMACARANGLVKP